MESTLEELDLLYKIKYIIASKETVSLLKENKSNVIAYIRVTQSGCCEESIKKQKRIIKDFCEKHNIKCKETYIDEGFSGMNFERPGIKKIIEQHKEDIVLVCDESRISRDYFKFLNFAENIKVISINSLIDE